MPNSHFRLHPLARSAACGLAAIALLAGACGCSGLFGKSTAAQSEYDRMQQENLQRLGGEDVKNNLVHDTVGAAFDGLWEMVKFLYNLAAGHTPVNYARLMEDANSPDNRRMGVFGLSDERYARTDPNRIYALRWSQLAFGDEANNVPPDADYGVRAAAIRALNRARVRTVRSIVSTDPATNKPVLGPEIDLILDYIAAMKDPHDLVRLEAAKALANMPDDRALDVLVRHLPPRTQPGGLEPDQDVRIACADALRNFRTARAAQALTTVLLDRQFGVAWQALQSLVLMTGKNFGYDAPHWLEHLRSDRPFAANADATTLRGDVDGARLSAAH